ncbi:uncharacterized protein [Arachis hypogaea]|uniref:uncharacterized protein n=1 Tax=Arachis hypogaea TaxID=3818 RepID=UPI003B224CF3
MRVHLLADLKKECQLLVEGYRSSWKSTGCTLMADGWTDQRQPSDMIKTTDTLFKLFAEVIEWVGSSNIVHVVTDNAANYVSTGKLIHEKYPNIFWSPCAAYCISLILKDVASIPNIANLASRASKLLRHVDADEKPSLVYMYEGMQRAKITIKTMFRNRKATYTPYTSILKMRWDKHLKRDLHAAAYFLNPGFFYSKGFVEKANILRLHRKKNNYDPIDIQSIDTVDFWVMANEDDPEFTNGDIEGIENLIYTDNAMPSYPKDGGDVEVNVDLPDVADSSNTASFGGTSEDGGFGLPVYDGDIGTLNDDYDFL